MKTEILKIKTISFDNPYQARDSDLQDQDLTES